MITGAARGIGAESARQLYARGHELALVGLEPQELEARAAELGSRAAATCSSSRRWRPPCTAA